MSSTTQTDLANHVNDIVTAARATFDRGRTLPLVWRLRQLESMRTMLRECEDEFIDALRADLGKSADEAFTTEIGFVTSELGHTLRHLRGWLRPKRVNPGTMLAPATSKTILEPLGVALIIGPWNYPVNLILAPLAGALAAGNAVVVKPSELAPASSALLAKLLPHYLDADAVRVVEGDADVAGELLALPFDHVFFTGSERVGRIVARAAAEHLTPTTLELGGKSPVFIDDTVDLDAAAKRIAWGRFTNTGQTCTAPDYVLAAPGVADALVPRIEHAIRQFYGDDSRSSADYGRIVNHAHYERLTGLLDSGRVVVGGLAADPDRRTAEAGERYLAPTVLRDVAPDSPVMREEIFGPILPIIEVTSANEAITRIRQRPKPLSLYVFSNDERTLHAFTTLTSAGSMAINFTLAQIASPNLPFGGVGASGMGAYHGEFSVRTFSHCKPITKKPFVPETFAMVFPPMSERVRMLVRRLMR